MSVPDGSIQITIHEWDRVKRGHDRYEFLRRLPPRYVVDLWNQAIREGGNLDEMIDIARAASGERTGL